MSQSNRPPANSKSLSIKSFIQESLRQCNNYISQQTSGADTAEYVEYIQKLLVPALNHYADYAERYARTSSARVAKEIKKCFDEQNARLEKILLRGQELYPAARLKVLLMNIQKQLALTFPLERIDKYTMKFGVLPFLNQAEVKSLFQGSSEIKKIYQNPKDQQHLKCRNS